MVVIKDDTIWFNGGDELTHSMKPINKLVFCEVG